MSIFQGATRKILELTCKCPKCGEKMVVPESRRNEASFGEFTRRD